MGERRAGFFFFFFFGEGGRGVRNRVPFGEKKKKKRVCGEGMNECFFIERESDDLQGSEIIDVLGMCVYCVLLDNKQDSD
jgi:hypothetical protein